MTLQGESSAARRLTTALIVEIALCVFLITVFCLMFIRSYEWEIEAALFPRLISCLGAASVLAYMAELGWKYFKGRDGATRRILDIPWAAVAGDPRSVKRMAVGVIAWALAFWVGITLVGFHVAAPLYLYSQLVVYGNVKNWVAIVGAGTCLLVIIFVYDRLAETTWNDPWLFDFVSELFLGMSR